MGLSSPGGGGGGFTPIVYYVESNTPGNTSATPGTPVSIPWDTFYDIGINDDVIANLPAELGLEYNASSKRFEALESGIWIATLNVDLIASPGNTGDFRFIADDYNTSPILSVLASSNPANWIVSRTVALALPGDEIYVSMQSAAASETFTNYAEMALVRIA